MRGPAYPMHTGLPAFGHIGWVFRGMVHVVAAFEPKSLRQQGWRRYVAGSAALGGDLRKAQSI